MSTYPWRDAVKGIRSRGTDSVRVVTFDKRWETFSRPAVLVGQDKVSYVVKALQPDRPDAALLARSIVTDAVLAPLGRCIGAPVPDSVLADVPAELIALEPKLQEHPYRIESGLAHGSQLLASVGQREAISHMAENRQEFVVLALFYGWAVATDHQMIYDNDPRHAVHSVDHGHFLGGPNWTLASIRGLPAPTPDAQIVSACALSDGELRAGASSLRDVSDDQIAAAVSLPPDGWGINMDDRVGLAEFLADRRDQLLTSLT
jgi:hypothetical protein